MSENRVSSLTIVAWSAVGLLILCLFLPEPPLWVTIPAWLVLTFSIFAWREGKDARNPVRMALDLTLGATAFFGLVAARTGLTNLFRLMFLPSWSHLSDVFQSVFTYLVLCSYLGFRVFLYGEVLRAKNERIARLEEQTGVAPLPAESQDLVPEVKENHAPW